MSETTAPADLSPAHEQPEFADKRRLYFASLAHQYKDLFALHRLSGQVERSEEYGVNEQSRAKRWGDPTEHCLVEAAAVGILADMLKLPPEDKDTLVRAAFIHDYRKKGEIEELRGVTDPIIVEASFDKTMQQLLDGGVDEKIVRLTEMVAHTSLPQFATLNQAGALELKEGIATTDLAMHYIDDVTRGTQLLGLDARIDAIEARKDLYPYNEEGRSTWGGRTFFEAQRGIGHLVENRLAEVAGVSDPSSLPDLITRQLIHDINNSGNKRN